jgi:NTE family protein
MGMAVDANVLIFERIREEQRNGRSMLGSIDTVSSVSGGSILAAHLVEGVPDWPPPGEVVAGWHERVVEPVLRFVSQDVRTGPLARRWLRPWNIGRTSIPAAGLEQEYFSAITQRRLVDLPERPRYIFCSSDLVFGSLFQFERTQVCGNEVGRSRTPSSWTVARAVAASSCFPPVFAPIRLRLKDGSFSGGVEDERVDDLQADLRAFEVSDGGVCDNMGLDAVWQDHRTLLVSDGGAMFKAERDRGVVWRLMRYGDVRGNQGLRVRKRWLLSNFLLGEMDGMYWGISSAVEHYPVAGERLIGYSAGLVDQCIEAIRTDLDVFSSAECSVLQNHGYTLANAAVRAHGSADTSDVGSQWPYEDWARESAVRRDLAGSARFSLRGHEAWSAFARHALTGR